MRIHDLTGKLVPTGRSTKVFNGYPADGGTTVPSFLTAPHGTLTGQAMDTSRGILSIDTGALANDRGTMQGPGCDWATTHTMIQLMCRGFRCKSASTTNIRIEIGITSGVTAANPIGAALIHDNADALPKARTLHGTSAAVDATSINVYPMRDAGYRSIGIAVYPRSKRWYVIADSGVLWSSGVQSNWGADAKTGIVFPYISIQTTNAVTKGVQVANFELTTETW